MLMIEDGCEVSVRMLVTFQRQLFLWKDHLIREPNAESVFCPNNRTDLVRTLFRCTTKLVSGVWNGTYKNTVWLWVHELVKSFNFIGSFKLNKIQHDILKWHRKEYYDNVWWFTVTKRNISFVLLHINDKLSFVLCSNI